MPTLTPEQEADVEIRLKEFKERYLALVTEFEVDFVSYPQYVQTGPQVFSTYNAMQLMDKKYAPVPSPITPDDL